MPTGEVQAVDRARAAQMIVAQLTGDLEMFAVALAGAVDDERDTSIVNLLRVLSEELAGILLDVHGGSAADLMRAVLARQLAEVTE